MKITQSQFSLFQYFRIIILAKWFIEIQMKQNQQFSKNLITAEQYIASELANKQLQFDTAAGIPNIHDLIVNSLQINKKLYQDIIKKQYEVKQQSHLINSKIQIFSKNIEQIQNQTKFFYEETVRQNNKSRFMFEQFIKPFQQQLKGKVDETAFTIKMKMILSEFDHLGHKIAYDHDGQVELSHNYAYKFIKQEILPLICGLQQQSQQKSSRIGNQQDRLSILQIQEGQLNNKIMKLSRELIRVQGQFNNKLGTKVDMEVFNNRLKYLQKQLFSHKINSLTKSLQSIKQQLTIEIDKLNSSIHQLQSNNYNQKLQLVQNNIHSIKQQIQQIIDNNINQSITTLQNNFNKLKSQFQSQFTQFQIQTSSKHHQFYLNQRQIISKTLQNFIQNVESNIQQFLLRYDKGLVIKVRNLQSQSKSQEQSTKILSKSIQKQYNQLDYIKDILSKKANFTDVIAHMDSKADRQDYKELKTLIHEKNNIFTEQISQQSCKQTINQDVNREQVIANIYRKNRSISGKKVYRPASPSPADADRQLSIKRYMLGLKNGVSNYTRQNLIQEKTKFLFINSKQRRHAKTSRNSTIAENI